MSELLTLINSEWTFDANYERVFGPTFERYDSGYDSVNRDGPFEFYVPVDEV